MACMFDTHAHLDGEEFDSDRRDVVDRALTAGVKAVLVPNIDLKSLQKLESVDLVEPVDEEHMYFAAMNSKSCRLTPLGKYYWKLLKDDRI